MSFFYAQIDGNGICYSVSQLADAITENATTIKVDTFDQSLLGKKYANGAWVVDPPLVTAQKAKIAELDAAYANALATFKSSALGPPHTYLADEKSMTYLTAEYTFVKGTDYDGKSVPWYTTEEGKVYHTAAQIVQVFLDGRASVQADFAKHDTKVAQVNACTTTAQVATIAWTNPNPPAVPTGLTGTKGTGQVALTWTASSDVTMIGGGGYNVYVDGGATKANATLLTGNTYTVTGLAAGAHTFTITAVDTDGNESAKSTAVSVTV